MSLEPLERDSTDPRWERITELVDDALRQDGPEERERFLRDACQGDVDLRREVEHLLAFEDVESDLLDRPSPPEVPRPGDRIGPYRVEGVLGDGGMGVVLRVRDPELDRDVALKLLHGARLTSDLLRRFDAERRILARLDHPGIARILGGGTFGGRPYFTMEIVDGEPIDAYCDRRGLSVTERVGLCLPVCQALAYAHRNLVVHRDLKPSNLLVTSEGQPKLLDFGIAKVLAPAAVHTRTGQQPFTLAFASPEQVLGAPLTAAEILRRGEERARRDLGGQPDVLAHQVEAIGLAHQMLGEREAALPLLEEALGLRRQVYPADHTLVARSLNNLAALVHEMGDVGRAEALYRLALGMRRRLGQPPEDLARIESNLALLVLQRGELVEAEELYRRLLETRRAAFGAHDPDVSNSLRSLGTVLYLRGELDAAEPYLRESLELRRAEPDVRPTRVAAALSSLGRVLHAQGRLEEAEEALVEALELRLQVYDDDHLHVALTRKDLASLYSDLGESATAKVLRSQALAVLRTAKPDGWEVADAESQLGERLLAEGRMEEAAVCLQESYEKLRRLRGEEALHTVKARERLARLETP